MQSLIIKDMNVQAKLVALSQSVGSTPTVNGVGSLNVMGANKIYLRMYAGTVAAMIREGNDLIVAGPDGEVLRLTNFYEGTQPRELLLMDGEGGLVQMETSRAVSDGPMPVYSTGVLEPSPFAGLTHMGDGSFVAGGAFGATMAALVGLGFAGAVYELVRNNNNNNNNNDDDDDGLDRTPPGAPGNITFSDNGGKLIGNAEPGSTVIARDASGAIIGTGTAGSDGRFEIDLNPPLINKENISVTATDAAGNVSPPASAIAPDLTAPEAASNLDVNDEGTSISGEGEVGAVVTVRAPDGTVLGTGTVGTNGSFTVVLSPPQIDEQNLQVVLTDAAGNISPPASAIAPDLTPPEAARNLDVNDEGTAISGEGEVGATVTVRAPDGTVIGTGTVGSDGRFTVVLNPPQIEGQNLQVVLTDDAGNNSLPASTLAPDVTIIPQPPEAPTLAIPEAVGGITEAERQDGIQVEVSLPAGRAVGDKLVITIAGGASYEFVLTAGNLASSSLIATLPGELVSGSYSISAVLVDAQGQSSRASMPVGFIILPDGASGPMVTIDNVTNDDVLNLEESQGSVDVKGTVQSSTSTPEFRAGDIVQVSANGTIYSGVVQSDGSWTVSVRGSDLIAGTVSATVLATDQSGIVQQVTATKTFEVDLLPPSNTAPTLSIPGTDDGTIDATELNAGLQAEVGLPAGLAIGDVVVVQIAIAGTVASYQHTIVAADLTAGSVTIPLGSSFADGTYTATAFILDPAGNSSPATILSYDVDAIALDIGSSDANVDELSPASLATGALLVSSPTVSLALSGPSANFTSRGEAITWQLEGADLVGTAGGRTVLTVSLDASGNYEVQLQDGIDHPAGSSTLTIPITVTATEGSDVAVGTISVIVADGSPTVAPTVTLSPTEPGSIVDTLVTNMGLDGGRMESVTIDGMTFNYSAANGTVSTSGSSSTILSHSFTGEMLTVTTIRGETVEIDMGTGDYRVEVTGREAMAPVNSTPYASMASSSGLLGLVNADLLGALKIGENQFFTASDLNNDLRSIELTYSAPVSLSGMRFVYNELLASELGIEIEQNSYVAIPGYNQITITAADGGTLDNWKLNEFLGTMTLGGGISNVLVLDLLSTLSIKATDSSANVAERSDFKLADVGIGSQLLNTVLPETFMTGTDTSDTLVASDGLNGAGLDNRIYGHGGNDRLEGGQGNDILRGGSGNDTLLGGEGNDILIGGSGVDTMTGGAGRDIFRFESGDVVRNGPVQTDIILDFSNASLLLDGDVLDLGDLLQGEGRVGKSAGNLSNFLHFEKTADGTVIHISTEGGYIGGFSSLNASATDHRILLRDVDLTEGQGSDTAIINDLLSRNKLLVDTKTSADPAAHGDLQIGGVAIDGDGDRANAGVTIDADNIGSEANNRAPTVGAEAENLLGLIGGNLAGLSLNTQDLLVADADNNLVRVSLEYAPAVALNLNALTFSYDQSLATALGYDVRIVQGEGILGLIGPSAQIDIFSTSGDTLDNAEINEFLQSVHLVDPQGGLLSTSLISANLLNSITLTAEDVWGTVGQARVDTFLDVNLLNTLDGSNLNIGTLMMPLGSMVDGFLEDDSATLMANDALDAGGTAFSPGYQPEAQMMAYTPPFDPNDGVQFNVV